MSTVFLNDNGAATPPDGERQPSSAKTDLFQRISEALNADLFIYSGPITRSLATNFINEVDRACNNENAALILCTHGGDPDAAYVIARILKTQYKKFTLFVFGHCKSAGTLIALGANEIVMSVRGELGPLDMQVLKSDELLFRSSSLDISQAIVSLSQQAYNVFIDHFIDTILRGGGAITTKTAADIATSLAVGLLSPITAQIDPLRVGEMERAINIGQQYGERLNDDAKRVERLIKEYPSHSFVIDYTEACSLFGNVRKPNELEKELESLLRGIERTTGRLCVSHPNEKGMVGYINPKEGAKDGAQEHTKNAQEGASEPGGEQQPGHPQGDEPDTAERDARDVRVSEAVESAASKDGQGQ